MDWSSLLSAAIVALMAFLGSFATTLFNYKGKKLELSKSNNEAVKQCQREHKADVEKVKEEFNSKLDSLNSKLDSIMTEQMNMIMQVAQLKKDTEEIKSSVGDIFDREIELEKMTSAHDARIDNLERLS